MKPTAERIVAYAWVIVISFGSPLCSFAQEPSGPPIANPAAVAVAPPDPNEAWPRATTYKDATIAIFQPQVENWQGNQLKARAAVRDKSSSSTDYGVIWLACRTEVDKVHRIVTLEDISITK